MPRYTCDAKGFVPCFPSPGSCLADAELQRLRALFWDYRDCFDDGSRPLKTTNLLQARLDTGDAPSISLLPRKRSPAMREIASKAVAEVDAQGITEPKTECWSTLIVMVRRANGSWRLCCDYREVNNHVRIPQQPMPRAEDISASFTGKRYFSMLDMCSGFHQDEAAEEDRPEDGVRDSGLSAAVQEIAFWVRL